MTEETVKINTAPAAEPLVPIKPVEQVVVAVKKEDVAPPAAVSANPGVQSQEQVEEAEPPQSESSKARAAVAAKLGERTPVMGGESSLPVKLAEADWTDRAIVKAVVNNQEKVRYPDLGCGGLMNRGYFYNDHAGAVPVAQVITTHPMYDMDWRWHTVFSSRVQGTKYTLTDEVEAALLADSKSVALVAPLARQKGPFFEGSVALSLATKIHTADGGMSGFSSLSLVAKLEGYLISLGMPPDDGLLSVASIPADSPAVAGQMYFPGSANPVAVANLPQIPAKYISLGAYNKFLDGNWLIPGFSPADVGGKVMVVPTAKSQVGQPNALWWTAVSQMHYPFIDISKEGQMSDMLGPLTETDPNGAQIPANNSFYPGSTLMTIEGTGITGANHQLVLFVLVEDYGTNGAPQLTFPVVGGTLTLAFETGSQPSLALVAFETTFAPKIAQDYLNGGAPEDIQLAMDYVGQYMGGFASFRDSSALWASHVNFSRLSGLVTNAHVPPAVAGGAFCPLGSARRDWVEARVATPIITAAGASASARPWGMPTNAVGMWPAVTFNQANNQAAVAPGRVHYEIPPFTPQVAVGIAAGIVKLAAPAPDILSGMEYQQAAPTAITHAREVAYSMDTMWAENGFPRSLMYKIVPPAGGANAVLASTATGHQNSVWGRRGMPISKDSASFSTGVSKWLFEGRVLTYYPTNGVVLRNMGIAPVWANTSGLVMARFDLPSIRTALPAFGKISESNQMNMGKTVSFSGEIFRPQNTRVDLAASVPDIYDGEDEKAWALSTELEGVGATPMPQGQANDLYLVYKRSHAQESNLVLPLFSPLTWGRLMALPNWQSLIYFEAEPWNLTSGRPVVSYDPANNQRYLLATNNRQRVIASDRYSMVKPAFYTEADCVPYAMVPADDLSSRYRAVRI